MSAGERPRAGRTTSQPYVDQRVPARGAIRRGVPPRAAYLPRTPAVAATQEGVRTTLLPRLGVATAAGLVLVSVAYTGSRLEAPWAEIVFWLGLLTIFVPITVALLSATPRPRQRAGAVVLLALALYAVKVLHSPDQFIFGDEFAHWRTAADIVSTGRLFTANPLSIVSPDYPGLQVVTAALVAVSGLSVHAAALVVIGVGRLLLALALFLVLDRVSRSARIAGVGSLIYFANSNFTFWSGQYAYESLALPLALGVIYLAVRHATSRNYRALDALMVLGGLALIPTHHLTSYAVIVLLVAWAVVAALMRRWGRAVAGPPVVLLVLMPAVAILWVVTVASSTGRYLGPVVGNAVGDALAFLGGQEAVKTFFRGDPALVSPVWERVTALLAVGLVAILLGVSLLLWLRRDGRLPRFRASGIAWTFALLALAYYPSQSLRLLRTGTEISNRSGEFLFLPIGFIVALALRQLWMSRSRPLVRAGGTALLAVVFMGGVIIGMPRWARMPGPYLVSGDTRAVTPEGIAASTWLRDAYGPGERLVADQTNALLMATYGAQLPTSGLSWIFFSHAMTAAEPAALAKAGVRFVVIDRRMTSMLPLAGYYFESGEPGAQHHTDPISEAALARFEASDAFVKVFDSGDIEIYELVGPVTKAAAEAAPPRSPDPCRLAADGSCGA